ncbi:nuclear factor of activated T-cells, cytoplasmic 4-like, partial [Mustelus asterias]
MHSPPPRPVTNGDTYESQPARLVHLGGCKVLACPSIQITSISPGDGDGDMEVASAAEEEDAWGPRARPPSPSCPWSPGRDQLYLPLDPFGYRESSLSPSSASSFSSRGWLSDAASSCGSASHVYDDVEPELREAALRFALGPPPPHPPSCSSPGQAWPADDGRWASPCPSPGPEDLGRRLWAPGPPPSSSRPASPGGKRRHSGLEAYPYYQQPQAYQQRPACSARVSPCPSPAASRRGSLAEEASSPQEAPSSPSSPLLYLQPLPRPAYEAGGGISVPHKTRRTSQEGEPGGGPYPGPAGGEEGNLAHQQHQQQQMPKKDAAPMEYLTVPSAFVWSKARVGGHSPVFRSSALPPLDWPLPSQYEVLDLKIDVQPKTHHRAHYETEGSRGAVKAAAGGHPVVK